MRDFLAGPDPIHQVAVRHVVSTLRHALQDAHEGRTRLGRLVNMKKTNISLIFLLVAWVSYGQQAQPISTIDFVQIVDGNEEEALYYYENNWKILREIALKRNYIASFQLMETTPSPEAPFHLMLITTYADSDQYQAREKHFEALIEEKGPLRLMNDKQPGDFRKIVFNKTGVRHR